jgi:hypothetical protein
MHCRAIQSNLANSANPDRVKRASIDSAGFCGLIDDARRREMGERPVSA